MQDRSLALILSSACALAMHLPAQSSLAWFAADDIQSLDTKAGPHRDLERFDLLVTTPAATGTVAFAAIPSAGWSAMIGDADADGMVAEFYNEPNRRIFNFSGCLLKREDKTSKDPRRLFVSVRRISNSAPKLRVHTNKGTVVRDVEPGDFFRILAGGDAEFFVTQALIMKAAGTQTASGSPGASAMTQTASGDLYYSPPNSGHYVSNGTGQVLAKDGSLIWIPASAITYDSSGNVSDIKAGSARLVMEKGTNSPSQNPTGVELTTNAGGRDSSGAPMVTTITNWVTNISGLCVDPAGGTWTSRLTGSVKHPHLWFVYDNVTHRGTIISTRPRTGFTVLGSLATFGGVTFGTRSGSASGAWLGVKGDMRGPAPLGLELVDWGVGTKAPHGLYVADTENGGGVDLATANNFTLALQATRSRTPTILVLGGGPSRGGHLASAALAGFEGFAALWTLNAGPITGFQNITDNFGRRTLVVPLPSNPSFLKGIALIWQGAFVNASPPWGMTNPIVTEFR